MHSVETPLATKHEITQLHAATCLLMTRFINGHHCPKLAHVIVQQLQHLLSHPSTLQAPNSRDMYQQLLDHWQHVSRSLSEQKTTPSHKYLFH